MIAVFCIHSQVLRKTKDEIFICMHHKFLVCSQNCMEQLGSQWTDFHEIWYLSVFRKSVRKNLNFIKIWQEQRIFHMKTCLHLWFLALFFLKSEMFQTNVVEKIKTHILWSLYFFSKIVPFMRKCGKILQSGAGHRWQYGACALLAGYVRLQRRTQYATLIAVPLQRLLHERTSVLRYTYSACLVKWRSRPVCK